MKASDVEHHFVGPLRVDGRQAQGFGEEQRTPPFTGRWASQIAGETVQKIRSVTARRLPEEKLKEAKESGSLIEASEVAEVIMFMLTRQRGMTIRDVVLMPTSFDL